MKNNKQSLILRNKGFTLVELLVVVAIIAILSVIGLTLFSGAQLNARDGRRKADIDAIANALETSKDVASLTYKPLTAGQFSSALIPTDSTTAKYSIKVDTTVTSISDPAIWVGQEDIATPNPPSSEGTWTTVDAATPLVTTKSWKVCARLETSNTTTPVVLKTICRGSAQ